MERAPPESRPYELLVFEHDGITFAIAASDVESVIAWREPVPLPKSAPGLRGVIQDRGRVVSVLSRPSAHGSAPRSNASTSSGSRASSPTRILVCATSHGYVGIPAMRARLVGEVTLREAPEPGAVVDSSVGALTYVVPERVVTELLAR